MGSTGTGRFSDYSGTPDGRRSGGNGQGGSGGSGGSDCDRAIGDIQLEEVGRCQFFITKNDLPQKHSDVSLDSELVSGRLAIKDQKSGLIIGYLPTRYNYLLSCMNEGFSYVGIVNSIVNEKTFPRVWVDLAPSV